MVTDFQHAAECFSEKLINMGGKQIVVHERVNGSRNTVKARICCFKEVFQ